MLRAFLAATFLANPASIATHEPPPPVVVNEHVKLQDIDGFGIAQAFRRTELVRQLPEDQQQQITDLWFNKKTGAGFSILRFGIGSAPTGAPYDQMWSIQPTDPGGPDAPPQYVWDHDDGSQVWLAKIAKSYGVKRFYGDAWSAPGYMKDNGVQENGGQLCGITGSTCTADWRAAYARYLVQWTKFYAQEGIRITDLGFTNEPDFTASYASMRFTPAQAVEFVKILGPIARGTGLKIACCDSFGWNEARAYTAAIQADPIARHYVDTYTGHTYASPVDGPQPTRGNVWMSEWNPNGSTWNENWDDGSGYDGMTIAQAVHDAMTLGNANGYVYWFGESRGATRGLMQVDVPAQTFHISKRFWALAAYSRFIRPGAVRLQASAPDPALKVSAFRNNDGSEVIEVLNTGTAAVTWKGVNGRATAYLTDGGNSLTPSPVTHRTVVLQPRALTTIVIK
ncbi:hypothetical protein J5X84_18260 [Streptosporangiaceae bacterium NEAU-GS5]|nr:hypothetical protein [Streptosporangiaceae bacterium NEAU-GS5]